MEPRALRVNGLWPISVGIVTPCPSTLSHLLITTQIFIQLFKPPSSEVYVHGYLILENLLSANEDIFSVCEDIVLNKQNRTLKIRILSLFITFILFSNRIQVLSVVQLATFKQNSPVQNVALLLVFTSFCLFQSQTILQSFFAFFLLTL